VSVAVGEVKRSTLAAREFDGRQDLGLTQLRPVHAGRWPSPLGPRTEQAHDVRLHGVEVSPPTCVELMDDDPLRIGQQHQHRRACCSRPARGRPEATTELDRFRTRGMRIPDDLDVTGPQVA